MRGVMKGHPMARGAETSHIVEQEDRSFTAVWGPFALKSAFQPIFRFENGKLEIAAFEALIRPFRDGQGVPPPAFFHLIPPGERLHVEALTRNLHLHNAGAFLDPEKLLFLNFDPSVFIEREMAVIALRDMRRTLQQAGVDPRRVVCEVTEQESTSEQALTAFVNVLRNNGFRIAVDDYGSVDSDMNRVAALRPDIVKFDARWITRLMETRPGVALLRVMVEEFATRGITSVFEGLEEHWQLELAEEAGAHMVQGYVLARPELAPTSFARFSGQIIEPQSTRPAAMETAATPQSAMPRRMTPSAKPFGRRPAS